MNIRLPFGDDSVPVDVPDNWINGRSYRSFRFESDLDPSISIVNALEEPVGASFPDLVADKSEAVVVVDSGAWEALAPVLPAFLETLEQQSLAAGRHITILFTNSLWMPLDQEFLSEAVPEELSNRYTVQLHDPKSSPVAHLGTVGDGIPLEVNSTYVDSTLKILFGPVQPNVVMGFTGGRSMILPGLASETSIKGFYRYDLIANPKICYGVIRDNPLHIAASEALMNTGADFVVSPLLSPEGKIAEVVAGDGLQSVMTAISTAREKMRITLKEPMDIVITTGGGAPWDDTLFHVFNAVSGAVPVLKENSTIIVAARMSGGFGPRPLEALLMASRTPRGFEKKFKTGSNFVPGQWIVQRLYEMLREHEIILHAGPGMQADKLWEAGLTPATDLQEAVEVAMQSHGQRCKICALPDGPFSLPTFGAD